MTYCLDSDIVVLQPYGRLRSIRTESRRELLVRNLSLFISVDIFGSCSDGKKWCGRNRTECDAILNYYHFYLSLENSLCPDYVTEKLYRALAHHAIPVVYGGANYSRFLPAGSYVNAVDFASPQELAKSTWQNNEWKWALRKLLSLEERISSWYDSIWWLVSTVPITQQSTARKIHPKVTKTLLLGGQVTKQTSHVLIHPFRL